ncbi:MAG TPA: phosphatidylserine/phosphatidylglycerophosphate/cardiolipin synthase family protein [Verrucomicrobiae bacterium]
MKVAPTFAVQWFCGGWKFFPAMLEAIRQARQRIELETYIFADDQTGRRLLHALTETALKGVRVRVLADAYGSLMLSGGFFAPLTAAGGEVHFFNPLRFGRFGVRDHRKLLVCDSHVVFIGGANVSDSYDGDGVTHGWFDLMARLESPELAARLAAEFDRSFSNADFELRRLRKLRVFRQIRRAADDEPRIYAVKPGRGAGAFQRALQHELVRAGSVDFIMPYLLPGGRLRKQLCQIVRRGGRVRLILPAHCDVPVARAAGLVYYARLLRAGVEIYEYQPQILHAKLYRVDEKVFAGSSNLDVRSFKLNYELMLEFTDRATMAGAKEIFSNALKNSRRIQLKEFRRSQNFWQRWKTGWAHFLLARIDPLVALRQLDAIPARALRPET